jgi:hypothetical protein
MGRFGIEIGGTGPGDYAKDGLGTDGEALTEKFIEDLRGLGLTVTFAAVLVPHDDAEVAGLTAAAPLVGEAPAADAKTVEQVAPVVQVPVEEGAFKCPECGREFDSAGACVGGEYGHQPAKLLPKDEVLNAPADAAAAESAVVTTSTGRPGEQTKEEVAAPAWPQ